MKFSERMGLTPHRTELQRESMDLGLRAGIWNVFCYRILEVGFSKNGNGRQTGKTPTATSSIVGDYLTALWHDFFKKPVDERTKTESAAKQFFKDYILKRSWVSVYDLVDFTTWYFGDHDLNEEFNSVLERELSVYRIVNNQITPITAT